MILSLATLDRSNLGAFRYLGGEEGLWRDAIRKALPPGEGDLLIGLLSWEPSRFVESSTAVILTRAKGPFELGEVVALLFLEADGTLKILGPRKPKEGERKGFYPTDPKEKDRSVR